VVTLASLGVRAIAREPCQRPLARLTAGGYTERILPRRVEGVTDSTAALVV
jgi:hypothetical protein